MEIRINEKNCLKKDLVVPNGFRIIEDWELLREIRTNKELKQLCIEDYVWTRNHQGNIRAAFLGCNGGDFHVSGGYLDDDGGRSRGVFVKNVKE